MHPSKHLLLLLLAALLNPLPLGAQPSEGTALLQAALEAHGGAQAAARSQRAVYTGTLRVERLGGAVERSVVLHAGPGNAYRAEIGSPGLERIFVSDGEAAWSVDNGRKRALPPKRSANLIFPYNPLAGLLSALGGPRLEAGAAIRPSQGRTAAGLLLADPGGRIPRAQALDRRYEATVDDQSGLVSSLTLFTDRRTSLRADEPFIVYEYSGYKEIDGMQVPFQVRAFSGEGGLLFELTLESFETVSEDPDVREP